MTAAIAASKNTTKPDHEKRSAFPQAEFAAAGCSARVRGRAEVVDLPHGGHRTWPAALAAHGFAGLPWLDRDLTPTRTGEQISRSTISQLYRHGTFRGSLCTTLVRTTSLYLAVHLLASWTLAQM